MRFLIFLSLRTSSWNNIISYPVFGTVVKWLNFKKGLSSFNVETNEFEA